MKRTFPLPLKSHSLPTADTAGQSQALRAGQRPLPQSVSDMLPGKLGLLTFILYSVASNRQLPKLRSLAPGGRKLSPGADPRGVCALPGGSHGPPAGRPSVGLT